MNFLPENYEAPKTTGHYMKLQDGENRIRILSRAIVGWEDWQDKKPIRFEMENKPLKPLDPLKAIKHFWAFVVYNYAEDQIQILQITQAGIRKALQALSCDEDWGDPSGYDLKIYRKGESINTEYSVNPAPHKPITKEIAQAFSNRPINLDALFDGSDPFSKENTRFESLMTELSKESEVLNNESSEVLYEEIVQLEKMLEKIPDYKKQVMDFLSEKHKIEALENLPRDLYEKIKFTSIKKISQMTYAKKTEEYDDFGVSEGQ